MKKTVFIFLYSLLMVMGLNANQVEYWHLKPSTTEEIEGEKYYTYPATVLSEKNSRIQLSITDSSGKVLLAFSELQEPADLSFGQKITLYIKRSHPQHGLINWNGNTAPCKMEWEALEMNKPSFETTNSDLFSISDQNYRIFKSKLTKNDYTHGADDSYVVGGNMDIVTYQHQGVDLQITFESASPDPLLTFNWSTHVLIYSEQRSSQGQVNVVNNDFMNLCKNWELDDEIIILSHENYPMYYWVVNTSKNGEAFFCKGLQAIYTKQNIWELLSQ